MRRQLEEKDRALAAAAVDRDRDRAELQERDRALQEALQRLAAFEGEPLESNWAN